jgi:tRNA(Ile)-lysidine synthetase-like protein
MVTGAQLPSENWPQLLTTENIELDIPGTVLLDAAWILRAEYKHDLQRTLSLADKNKISWQAWVDVGEGVRKLMIRPRKMGDRLQPLGMESGTIKLSDLFINEKIPKRARDRWPLVCLGDDIVWVPGLRTADAYKLTHASRDVVYIQLLRDR